MRVQCCPYYYCHFDLKKWKSWYAFFWAVAREPGKELAHPDQIGNYNQTRSIQSPEYISATSPAPLHYITTVRGQKISSWRKAEGKCCGAASFYALLSLSPEWFSVICLGLFLRKSVTRKKEWGCINCVYYWVDMNRR